MTHGGRTLGQALRAAREARGWDVARVERETRIRSRYLVALEEGDYRDLPGAVYTRGFVRNYAVYLGLDPDVCLDLYRREVAPELPRPAVTPLRHVDIRSRGALILTPARVATATLIVLVVAFIGYLAYQFLTFAATPELTVLDPATDVAAYAGTSYVLRGETVPNAQIEVDGLRENPEATASASGFFSIRVDLVPGSNVITLLATDPVTGRSSDPVTRTITVTLPIETPAPSGSPPPPQPPGSPISAGPIRQDNEAWPTSRSTW